MVEDVKMNSKEYWDYVYDKEINNHMSRRDIERWDLIINQIEKHSRVIEFGSGTGEFINYLATKRPFCKFTGIDISPKAISYSKQQMPNFNWMVGDSLTTIVLNKVADKEIVDVIVSQHTLEHLIPSKMEVFFNQAIELLDTNGKLILVWPINDSEWQEHYKIWTLKDMEDLIRKYKSVFKTWMVYRPQTSHTRKDNHNEGDFEEAIIIMIRK